MAKCKTCHAEIVWGMTAKGKRVPLDPPEKRYVKVVDDLEDNPVVIMDDTWLSHFATCPQADQHRKEKNDG